MMKSFFKKLAFVMALAMVVTMAAPAAQASAADALGIVLQNDDTWTVKETDEVEVGATVDYRYKGAPKNYKELDPTWASSKEDVATVDKNGLVTTLKAGETVISISLSNGQKGEIKLTVKAAEADKTFEAAQVSDAKLTLTFADTTITKDQLAAGLTTYFYVGDVKVNYPVFKVNDVKNGVAEVESYVLFTDGTTYGFTYGEESAEFTAVIGEVAYVTAKFACEGTDYAAYVGKNTKVTASLFNEKGYDITKSAKGYVTYALVTESTNGDYWPAGATGEFYFNTAGVSAQVKVTYMTGKYDEMYNPIAGPDTTISLYSTNMPKYDIDPSQAPVATIATGAIDWSKASTVIALNDDRNTTDAVEKLVVKLKDNRGNKNVVTNEANANGTFTFKSTNDSILYVAADGTIMTNKPGDVSVLVYLTLNETNAQPKVVAVVPVYVKAAREAATVDASASAAVVSTATGYNTAEFKFTVKDQLGAKINSKDYGFEVWCNNANSLPTGAKKAPEFTWTKTGTGEYKVVVEGSTDNLPTDANGYTYTYTVRVNWWITKTFSVTVRKPVADTNGNTTVSGYKLDFSGATDIKTLGNTTTTTVSALKTTATLYLLSNNVKYDTADLEVKPASIDQMKVGKYYYTIAKNGSLINVADEACVNTVDGKVVIDLTKFKDGNVVDKSKLGTGTYTIVVYKGEGTGTTGVATASTFYQVTSGSVTVGDTQDTMSYLGRNGNNYVAAGTTLDTIVKTKFKFQIGNVTLDDADDYTNNNITIWVSANTVSNGTVAYINGVSFKKRVGVDNTGAPVYVEYWVNVGDYVNFQ